MTLYDDYRNTDYLSDISFIAGSEMTLSFPVYDESGVPVDLSGSTIRWLLGIYGQPDSQNILNLEGIIDGTVVTNHIFDVTLTGANTSSLGDSIYLQQMIITDSAGKVFRPAQGIVVIRKAIPTS
ncbi:MAG: hypothetical protein WA061_02420 [Microgenomates group bacterium]